jgi:cytochrome c oxidase subunit 2
MTSYFEFTPTITTEEMKVKTNNPKFNYILLCAKICGANHFNMQKNVRVVSEQEYKEWVIKQGTYLTNDLRKVFKLPVIAEPAAQPVKADTAAKDTTAKTNQLALKK